MRDLPSALLMFLDRRCAPHAGQGATVGGPPASKRAKKTGRQTAHLTSSYTVYILSFVIFIK